MTEQKALGSVLVGLRKKRGLDQRQFAKASKLAVRHIDRLEKGKQRTITLPVLFRIAKVLGVKSSYISSQMLKRMKPEKS